MNAARPPHPQANLPRATWPALDLHAHILKDVLGSRLVGIYVHGSAAMGGYDHARSDIDYLAIVEGPLIVRERTRLGDAFLRIAGGPHEPGNGMEMSIVCAGVLVPEVQFPTPYEFHFGNRAAIERSRSMPTAALRDPDLAGHIRIVNRFGVCIHGAPIEVAFGTLTDAAYLASIVLDSRQSYANVEERTPRGPSEVPAYAVLNFCRVLAFMRDKLVVSKDMGAAWARTNVPEEHQDVIAAALKARLYPGSVFLVDGKELKAFARYAYAQMPSYE